MRFQPHKPARPNLHVTRLIRRHAGATAIVLCAAALLSATTTTPVAPPVPEAAAHVVSWDWHGLLRQLPITALPEAERAAAQYALLLQRLADTNDSLAGIAACAPALRITNAADIVYRRARGLISTYQYRRAENLFTLLLAPENSNGFTKGNAHFWLAWLRASQHRDLDGALQHYLRVHAYPACLVYTDAAYYHAANLYALRRKQDTALALLAIRVPSIDYYKNEMRKATASYESARSAGDLTNQIRQLLRYDYAAQRMAASQQHEAYGWASIVRACPAPLVQSMRDYMPAHDSFDDYTSAAIQRALTGPDAGTNDPVLADMLLHEWPSFDWVATHHPLIITNRPLSNNIFEHKRRVLNLTPNP